MPTLHWIGKEKVINHHLDVPFRVLKHQYTFDNGTQKASGQPADAGDLEEVGNKIIHGDNLEALKTLLPEYEGKIKCIYIDPPYNTGKEGWTYNDNVNDPKIKKWLHSVVGKEGEDLSRHDKWLCMMYPRLKLLHKLLASDGVMVTSIDNNEYSSLSLILDEIFGKVNFIGTVIWKNANDNNPTNIATEHEYILFYAKNKSAISPVWKSSELDVKRRLIEIGKEFILQSTNEEDLQIAYTKWYRENKSTIWPFEDYKFIDNGGIYTGSRSVHNPGKEGYRYDVIHPITGKPCTQPQMGYRFPPETMQRLLDEQKILFGKDETKLIELKLYVADYRAKLSSVIDIDGRAGTNTIKQIFPESNRQFDFPKPFTLLEEVLSFITKDEDTILDSFAGSGTTAHAVLNLNKQDGGNRKFILIEMEDYAESITAERVKRVINGYGHTPNPSQVGNNGTGGSFDYYELGEPMFLEEGVLNEAVAEEEIRRYVYYTETQTNLPEKGNSPENVHFLGKHNDTSYYFFYEKDAVTSLDHAFLSTMRTKAEQYVIYADNCLLTKEFMVKHHIIFKKIPRDIIRF